MEVLKVSSRSNPNSVAGAVAGVVRQSGIVEVQVIGAGALNQAVKAIAIARGYVAPSGIDLVCVPTFADIMIDGEGRTAIRLSIEDRARRPGVPGASAIQTANAAAASHAASHAATQAARATDAVPPRATVEAEARAVDVRNGQPASESPAAPADTSIVTN